MVRPFLFSLHLHRQLDVILLVNDDLLCLLLFRGETLLTRLRFDLILLSFGDLLRLSPSLTVLSLDLDLVHVGLRHQLLLASSIDLWRLCFFSDFCSLVRRDADAWLSSLEVELVQERHHP